MYTINFNGPENYYMQCIYTSYDTNHVKWRTPLTTPSVVPPIEKQGTSKLP